MFLDVFGIRLLHVSCIFMYFPYLTGHFKADILEKYDPTQLPKQPMVQNIGQVHASYMGELPPRRSRFAPAYRLELFWVCLFRMLFFKESHGINMETPAFLGMI